MKRLFYSACFVLACLFVLGVATAPPIARAQQVRYFYLTAATHQGNTASAACTTGYHMAGIVELQAIGALKYLCLTSIAYTANGDQGPAPYCGPPTGVYG
jgi:hypothetical protein